MIDLNEYPLKEFWKKVKKRRWWIILFASACLTGAFFYIYRTQPSYSISMKVVMDDDIQSSLTQDLIQAAHTTGILPNEQANSRIEDMTSPEKMEKVVSRLGMETAYYSKKFLRVHELYTDSPVQVAGDEDCAPFFNFTLTKKNNGELKMHGFRAQGTSYADFSKTVTPGDTIDTPAGKLVVIPTDRYSSWQGSLTVNRTPASLRALSFTRNLTAKALPQKASVITLTLEDISPERAKAILNTLMDVYDEDSSELKEKTNRAVLDFLASRISVLEKELGDIEDQIKNFKQNHHITDIGQAGNTLYSLSATYGNKAFDVGNQLAIAKMIRDFITDPAHINDLLPANSGLANSALIARIDEYNRTMLERDRAYVVSSEDNPHVKEKTNSLDRLRLSIIRSIDSLIGSLNLELDRQLEREKELLGKVAKNSEEALDLLTLERQRKIKEQLYIFLLQKKEENELRSLLNVGRDFHTTQPTGGASPVSPRKSIILLAALLLGLMAPVVLIYFTTLYDGSVRKVSEMKGCDLPLLGGIPLVKSSPVRSSKSLLQVVRPDGKDTVNDAFRILRTRLDSMKMEPSPVILVTSPGDGYGKSFIAANLASAMALKGERVIVVDTDLRDSALTDSLARKESAGAADYLRAETGDILRNVVTLEQNVDFLPAGHIQGNPAELLVSERLDGMLTELRSNYSYIFLDSPSMESVADSSILAPHASLSIIVLRAGKYQRRMLPELGKLCDEDGHRRPVTVLNGIE